MENAYSSLHILAPHLHDPAHPALSPPTRRGPGAQSVAAMAPSAQAGGGRGQAPAAGIRHGIRAVLLGPPGAGKGTQVRAMRAGTAGGTGPPGFPHCRHSACDPRVEGRGCPPFRCPRRDRGVRCVPLAPVLPTGSIPPPGARSPGLFVPDLFVPG